MEDPYRSEIECLRAENERLRAELATRRVPRPLLAVVLAALDLGLVVELRPWLNGPSDGAFWGALAGVGLLGLGALLAAIGVRRVPR